MEINYEKNMQMLALAVKYCEENFFHDDLIKELSLNDDLKKQICIIKINSINSQEEADLLVFNLTQHSGPIRETSSYKILDLIKNDQFNSFFQTKEIYNVFVKAITDINPSVSRNMVEIIKYINDKQYLYSKIIDEIKKTISELDETRQNRSYVLNKKNFNLYWNIEAIISIADKIIPDIQLQEILVKTAHSNDYTIREKTAKAASILAEYNNEFNNVLYIMSNDDNIYVKKYIK